VHIDTILLKFLFWKNTIGGENYRRIKLLRSYYTDFEIAIFVVDAAVLIWEYAFDVC
jgi:hypothetical protein